MLNQLMLCAALLAVALGAPSDAAARGTPPVAHVKWIDCAGCSHSGPILTTDNAPPAGITISSVSVSGEDGTCLPRSHGGVTYCDQYGSGCAFRISFRVVNNSATETVTASGPFSGSWNPGDSGNAAPSFNMKCGESPRIQSITCGSGPTFTTLKSWTSYCSECDQI